MLKIIIPEQEVFNQETQEFYVVESFELELEHSLVSLSKWESVTNKPFLTNEAKSPEELLLYVEMMILSPIYPKDWAARLTGQNIEDIKAYIESAQSATTFGEMPKRTGPAETITSELIYYWMVAFSIPFEAEVWHLNRLFSLVRICNVKNQKPKKMSARELAERNRLLNKQRRERYNTAG